MNKPTPDMWDYLDSRLEELEEPLPESLSYALNKLATGEYVVVESPVKTF